MQALSGDEPVARLARRHGTNRKFVPCGKRGASSYLSPHSCRQRLFMRVRLDDARLACGVTSEPD